MAALFTFDGLTMDDRLFRMDTWTRSASVRVARRNTVGGYRVLRLPPDPPSITVSGRYAPAGVSGRRPPVRSTGENWYVHDLSDWEAKLGETGRLQFGRIAYGDYLLETVDLDHRDLAVLSASGGVAPRTVSWTLRFVAVREDVVVLSPQQPPQVAALPGAGVVGPA